jgi:hypothetical protein
LKPLLYWRRATARVRLVMKSWVRGWRVVLACATGSCCALLIFASGASAALDRVTSGSLTMTSDPDDYVGGGQSYSFATPSDVFQAGSDATNTRVSIRETSPQFSHNWELDFSAPDGQQLVPGTYTGAVRDVVRGPGQPGLDVFGDGRGCSTLWGSFTVLDASYGPNGYIESFDATFEQHCQGNTPALRGEVRIANTTPPPPPTTVQVTVDATGELAAHGTVTVHGTVSCSVELRLPFDPALPVIFVSVTEQTKDGESSSGNFSYPASCSPTATAWTTTTPLPLKGLPFVKGVATVTASTTIADPIYPLLFDTGSQTAQVRLNEG